MRTIGKTRRNLRLALLGLNRPRPASNVQVTYFYDPGSKHSHRGSQKLVERSRRRTRQPKLARELSVFAWLLVAGGLLICLHLYS
jgi:hypothetical protein